MNAFNLIFNKDKYFYYQVGEIHTKKPWNNPNYNNVYNLLSDINFLKILNNNFYSYIIGKFLWDFNTNDFDLYLIPKTNPLDYNKLENHINDLNNISLNEYKILLDITISDEKHTLSSKNEIIKSNNEFYFKKIKMIKIGYYKKIIGEIETIFDFNHFKKTKNAKKLNNRYIIEYISSGYNNKIKERILNSKKENLLNYLDVNNFLMLNEKEFLKIQNY